MRRADLATPSGRRRPDEGYAAFGKPSATRKDWGYAALIEYDGKRILFDTGNNPEILALNAWAKGFDLSTLDFVVMSHRHGDHMGGLAYLLRVNAKVKVYALKEGFGVYGADLPGTFYRKDASLPPEQRYYDGAPTARPCLSMMAGRIGMCPVFGCTTTPARSSGGEPVG